MSKKTRKKSSTKPSKTSAGKPAAARTARAGAKTKVKKAQVGKQVAKPVAKKPAAKAGKAVAGKSPKAAKPAAAKESHKAASKPLKSNLSSASKPAAAPKAAVAPKPPAASKPVSAPKPASAPKAATTAVEGGKAPGFRLPRDGGDTVSLADYAGRKLVLFFYPRADTPGCTREAQDFTRLKGEFAQAGAEVIGVSADTVKAQEAFRNKHELGIPLVSDEQHEMLEAYGAWGEKSMYGRSFMGIIRTTVLIGADGGVARIWRNVRVDGHAEEVLTAAGAL